MRHFLGTSSLGINSFQALVAEALELKKDPTRVQKPLAGKTVGLLFFNSSLRTRASMAVAVSRLGGYPLLLDVGSGVWNLETQLGVRMDGDRPEHIKEAVSVLSSYVDILGVRCFSKLEHLEQDAKDSFMARIVEYATVPVINLESAWLHPCQGLADAMTIRELLGEKLQQKKIVLSWAPHPKPLPMAVPNSFLHAATQLGAQVTLACPLEYALHPRVLEEAHSLSKEAGGSFQMVHDQNEAFADAHVIYAKSWGAGGYYGRLDEEAKIREGYDWLVNEDKMARTKEAYFMHCLPVRRNVVVSDGVLDGPRSAVIAQAENRLHAQIAVLKRLGEQHGVS